MMRLSTGSAAYPNMMRRTVEGPLPLMPGTYRLPISAAMGYVSKLAKLGTEAPESLCAMAVWETA